jgi:hypothetical protein
LISAQENIRGLQKPIPPLKEGTKDLVLRKLLLSIHTIAGERQEEGEE